MKPTDRITEKMVKKPQTKRGKIGNIIAYVALAFIAMGIGMLLMWSSASEDVLQIHNEPFPVRTIRKHPTADGVVILSVDYCKETEAVGRVRTSFVSQSREIFLPIGEDRSPPGCNKMELPILIPHETPADTYKIKFRAEYKINPLKTVVEEFVSSEFTVDEQR